MAGNQTFNRIFVIPDPGPLGHPVNDRRNVFPNPGGVFRGFEGDRSRALVLLSSLGQRSPEQKGQGSIGRLFPTLQPSIIRQFRTDSCHSLTRWNNWGEWVYFIILFLNGPSFSFIFVFSSKHNNFYNKYMWKNVHPVYGAGIRTHNLSEPPPKTRSE